ncbi:hypothetical protein BV22DRAFT_77500 [Leucogyrophana mollusca]|uniref:Uncharacterized protein n=1 Tax=Leucogyrophana mollusca TaxID=85980 RepID=A0ACB8BVY8_9AGAM|nr:hypothetical protein BV22DRAFT_77500 [Leucogyrophana mollusca]
MFQVPNRLRDMTSGIFRFGYKCRLIDVQYSTFVLSFAPLHFHSNFYTSSMHNTDNRKDDSVKHSEPIPINIHHSRHRSASVSSDSSSSPSSPPQVQTPLNINPPRIPTVSPSSSPILYFLSQSPTKTPATFPFRGWGGPPVFEEELPAAAHARRASTAGRFGAALLRRLSLGNALVKPSNATSEIPRSQSPPRSSTPPNSAVSPTTHRFSGLPTRKAKRSATISVESGRPRRAPSPMGERILKGHFDGFN